MLRMEPPDLATVLSLLTQEGDRERNFQIFHSDTLSQAAEKAFAPRTMQPLASCFHDPREQSVQEREHNCHAA